jgi:DNA-binding NtrC family response regulator
MREKPLPPVILLVLPQDERRNTLLRHLESLKLTAAAVSTFREVRERLKDDPRVDVVITGVSLRDGNWCDVLGCVVSCGVEARVVVSSPVADERLWSEVLWRGVYDVLVEPYDPLEVRRILDGALRSAAHIGLTRTREVSGSRPAHLVFDRVGVTTGS